MNNTDSPFSSRRPNLFVGSIQTICSVSLDELEFQSNTRAYDLYRYLGYEVRRSRW